MPNISDCAAESVRQILIQLYSMRKIQPSVNISPIIRQTVFYLYEGGEPAKWLESRPHSSEARRLRNVSGRLPRRDHPMRYDHAIPLKVLSEGFEASISSEAAMRKFLESHVQGVIITKQEDDRLNEEGLTSRMPEGSNRYDLLARYRTAGIRFEPEDEAKLLRTQQI